MGGGIREAEPPPEPPRDGSPSPFTSPRRRPHHDPIPRASPMDFFQHQETARRRTGLLIVYFLAAVVLIVLLAYVVVAGAFALSGADRGGPVQLGPALWDPALFAV